MRATSRYGRLLIGRERAVETLELAYAEQRARLVAVIGRRRVGKTYLVRTVFAERLAFSVTGIARARLATQLEGFRLALEERFGPLPAAEDTGTWLRALAALTRRLDEALAADPARRVVFFDELPWLASRRSGFLAAFSWFWNSWAVDRSVTVVICGSAAAWMIRKVVRDKGGLHNRITDQIVLRPFSLGESDAFLEHKGTPADPYQRLQLYLALGGVPFYLDQVRRGESATQAIDRLLFGRDAPLAREFDLLYASLFERPDTHLAIVRRLSGRPAGVSRQQIVAALDGGSGGHVTRALEELELSGFVTRSVPYGGRKRDTVYWLSDEYSAFYLKFLSGGRAEATAFAALVGSPAYRAWAAIAFERVCLKHAAQIARALGINGISYAAMSYRHRGDDEAAGVQVDLLLDRADRVVTICEVKFAEDDYVLSRAYADELRRKVRRFRTHAATKKHVSVVLVTTFGLVASTHAPGLIDAVVTLDDLTAG